MFAAITRSTADAEIIQRVTAASRQWNDMVKCRRVPSQCYGAEVANQAISGYHIMTTHLLDSRVSHSSPSFGFISSSLASSLLICALVRAVFFSANPATHVFAALGALRRGAIVFYEALRIGRTPLCDSCFRAFWICGIPATCIDPMLFGVESGVGKCDCPRIRLTNTLWPATADKEFGQWQPRHALRTFAQFDLGVNVEYVRFFNASHSAIVLRGAL